MSFCQMMLLVIGSAKLVEYRFSVNYGQVFVDYSGNNNHGVNGDSHLTSSKDTVLTDRGAFFDESTSAITIPKNTLVTTDVTLSSTFTLLCWFLSDDKTGVLFHRYKSSDSSNNYLTVSREDSGNKFWLSGKVSGSSPESNFLSNGFANDIWVMISIVSTGTTIKGYTNGLQQVSITFATAYSESSSYLMTIGSTSTAAVKGIMWYFVILDNDSTGQSNYYSTSSSTCLTSSCSTCDPSIMDPSLGKGCVSKQKEPLLDAGGGDCSGSTYGCTTTGLLDCSSCTCGSCIQTSGISNCWCPSGCTASTYSCYCPSGAVTGWTQCCDLSCKTCSSTSTTTCLTCLADNAVPDGTSGCKCSDGYYGTKPLYTMSACTACNSECATCSQANICLTCKSTNASPDATSGCNCNSGYYSIGSQTDTGSCLACHSECATCATANLCSSCKSSNASPDTSAGCNCDSGYYSLGAQTDANSCIGCNLECLTCVESSKCTSCISSHASPDSTLGCKCDSGYYSVGSRTAVDSCLSCFSECTTCSEANKCTTCISANSSPDSTQGCNCDNGYYSLGSQTVINSCLSCYSECSTCSDASKCLTCKSTNATPDATSGCNCNSGYYGTKPLSSTISCAACYSECSTCTQASICLTCISSNSSPQTSLGCKCHDKYYSISALTAVDSCLPCFQECSTCNQVNECLTCISSNASPDTTAGCKCESGYYSATALTQVNSCLSCQQECSTCQEAEKCLTCKSSNASPGTAIGCDCNDGYYSLASLTSSNSCLLCNEDCLTCENADTCILCKVKSANIDVLGCTCPALSDEKNNSCVCSDGYYMHTSLEKSNECRECHKSCETCTNQDQLSCIECKGELSKDTTVNTCSICPNGKYNNDSVCYECDSDCLTCINFDFCLSCTSEKRTENLNTGQCELICDTGQVNINETCKNCPGLCDKCNELFECIDCSENAESFDGECVCKRGFEKMSKCAGKYFSGKLSVSSLNNLKLKFNEEAEKRLSEGDFKVIVSGNISYSWELRVKTNSFYEFMMTYNDNIGSGIQADVEIITNDTIFSVGDSMLDKYSYNVKLNEDIIIPQTIQDVIVVTDVASKLAVSTTIGIAILSNPAAAWAFINTIQMITYLPINSNPLTPSVETMCTSLGGINIVPNVMTYMFDSEETKKPYDEASDYGFKSSVFWINIGPTVTLFIIILAAWPLVFLLTRFELGKLTVKFLKVLSNYKYSVFLRFWTQTYIDFGFLSLIQLKSPVNSFSIGFFHVASAVVSIILFFITPPLFFVSSYISYGKIKDPLNSEFSKKFGSLFTEFKNDKGFLSTQFYFVYFTRRLAYVLTQVYLNKFPYIQGGLNVGFSIGQVLFIVYYRPFKSTAIFISTLVGDLCVTLVFSISILFLGELSSASSMVLESVVIFTIIGGMGAQFLVSIYTLCIAFKAGWLKIEKYRSKKLMKNLKNSSIINHN